MPKKTKTAPNKIENDAETIENDTESIESGAETKHLNLTRTARPPRGPGSSNRIQILRSSLIDRSINLYLERERERERDINDNVEVALRFGPTCRVRVSHLLLNVRRGASHH